MKSDEGVSPTKEAEGATEEAPELITFFIPLATPLNLPNTAAYTFPRDDGAVSLKIWRPKQVQPWHTSPLDLARE